MAEDKQSGININPDEDVPSGNTSSFAWEFEKDLARDEVVSTAHMVDEGAFKRRSSQETNQIVVDGNPIPKKGEPTVVATNRVGTALPVASTLSTASASKNASRFTSVRYQLERALDRWWGIGEVPSLQLLRDGLLMLEAGGAGTEGQRTLLLRAALVHGRGLQTAMRYQVDSERVAMVLAEALIEWEPPLDPMRLSSIVGDDDQVRDLLAAELERSRILLTGEGRRRAVNALQMLPPAKNNVASDFRPAPSQSETGSIPARKRFLRQVLLLLLFVTLIGFLFWQQRKVIPSGMVEMPAAEYAMLGVSSESATTSVRLDAYFIDRFEVTNELYRACVDRGQCAWPKRTTSTTRPDYFMNPAFNDYPVVNVTQEMARTFCAWQEKRLPTAAEWQAAASVSPTTGQAYRYPWGESFDPQRTNSTSTEIGDTTVVGSFRPSGDSASGASDMAGNVAEWTATLDSTLQPSEFSIIKGGSFVDGAETLMVGSNKSLESAMASPEVGFRCARTHLLSERENG